MSVGGYANSGNWNTAGDARVYLTSNMTGWPNRVNMAYLGDDCWGFDFAVQGLTEAQADELSDKIMLVLCGGGRVRHTRLGAKLLGCKRMVASSFKRLKGSREDGS